MRHLSRWAKNRILFSNGTKRYAIAKSVGGDLQRAVRHVHADNLFELLLQHEPAKQISEAATQVQHALRAAGFERIDDRIEALLVQADLLLNKFFFLSMQFFNLVHVL